MNYFGSNIKFLRERLSLTQEEMQQQVKISGKTLSNYERGNTEPPIDVVIYLSKFFGIDLNDLLLKDLRINAQLKSKMDISKKDKNAQLNAQPSAQLKGKNKDFSGDGPGQAHSTTYPDDIGDLKRVQRVLTKRLKEMEDQLAKLLNKPPGN